MHNIKVRYHIVGKQEELQEIYDLYQTFIQKERPAMEEDEADDWEGNIILALGVDYGTCNLCGMSFAIKLSVCAVLSIFLNMILLALLSLWERV
jgi:hypothetical protein